jgi:hypothetical protein
MLFLKTFLHQSAYNLFESFYNFSYFLFPQKNEFK